MRLDRLDARALRDGLSRGEFSSEEVVRSLIARADETEPRVNGFTVRLRDEALAEARRADRDRARQGVRGPLHGLPITVKDNVDVAGLPSTMGFAHLRSHRAGRDAAIVEAVRAAGAVVLGKSNVPQALVPMDCSNRPFGRTHNPWSGAHVTGGSSGGEAALLASGASVLGLGTDLGGSIRFPAAFCGVAGLKPTLDRWPNRGLRSPLRGQEIVRAQVGPMARSARDLALFFEAVSAGRLAGLDARVAPLDAVPHEGIDVAALRIGWCGEDGFFPPAPAMRRAVHEARDSLVALGAELVEVTLPDQAEIVACYLAGTSSDGMRTLKEAFAGEPPVPALRTLWAAGSVPRWARRAVAWGLDGAGEERLAWIVRSTGERRAAALWRLADERTRRVAAEIDWWRDERLDALILPASASPAVPIGMDHDFSLIFSYFGRFNLTGFPAGVVPATRVRASEAHLPLDGDRFERRAAAVAARSAGLPVAVQVVGRPWHESVVLAVLVAIEEAAHARGEAPRVPVDPFVLQG